MAVTHSNTLVPLKPRSCPCAQTMAARSVRARPKSEQTKRETPETEVKQSRALSFLVARFNYSRTNALLQNANARKRSLKRCHTVR